MSATPRRRTVAERILAIAANTFRETIRNKILYAILAFALLVIGLTYFLAELSFGELTRIIADMGLAAIQLFGVLIAVFLGITLIHQEVERKTVYLTLSRPVSRWEFVVGKTLGLCLTLAMIVFVMAAVLFSVHAAYRLGGRSETGIFLASAGILMELVTLTCLASLFSTFTTPVLSAIFTISMFLLGHVTRDLLVFGDRSSSTSVRIAARGIYYLLPDLEHFNWKNEVVYGQLRSLAVLLPAVGYMIAYCVGVLSVACLLFSRKDLK
jgi:ABC-type transport system involved in multi-copper enzyme maturation permease subunit